MHTKQKTRNGPEFLLSHLLDIRFYSFLAEGLLLFHVQAVLTVVVHWDSERSGAIVDSTSTSPLDKSTCLSTPTYPNVFIFQLMMDTL